MTLRHSSIGSILVLGLVGLSPVFGASSAPSSGGQPIDAWGDSLTTGTPGIGGLDGTWPYQLSILLNGREVRNFGVSGQISDSIAARQGALVARLDVAGNALPAKGPVPVNVVNGVEIPGAGTGEVHGTLDGIPGDLAYSEDYHHLFVRDTAGAPVSVPAGSPFLVDDHRGDINVIWAGRNDVNLNHTAQTIGNIARMTARADHGRFIVLSILNGAGEGRGTAKHETVVKLNRELAARFPDNFIDVREALVARAGHKAVDQQDREADVVPSSLRVDDQHLSAEGYGIVAQQVAHFIGQRGW